VKLLAELIGKMTEYECGVPERVGHFLKVYGYASAIGELENLPDDVRFTLETAAIVHDIGIKPSLAKYGSSAGKLQEEEGIAPAREVLSGLGFLPDVVERVCFLVAHHHTDTEVDGLDYQILLEADFLVNMHEEKMTRAAIQSARDKVFKTETGKMLCKRLYLI
jgi:HD superfamily phosphodiesterase